MKTERITVLASAEFKAFLTEEAQTAGMSVSELVRQRCLREPTTDEQLLSALSKQLRESTIAASKALDMGLAAAEKTRKMIKSLHNEIPTSEVAV